MARAAIWGDEVPIRARLAVPLLRHEVVARGLAHDADVAPSSTSRRSHWLDRMVVFLGFGRVNSRKSSACGTLLPAAPAKIPSPRCSRSCRKSNGERGAERGASLSIYITSHGARRPGSVRFYGMRARDKFLGFAYNAFRGGGFSIRDPSLAGLRPLPPPGFRRHPVDGFWILSSSTPSTWWTVGRPPLSVGIVSLLMIAGAAALLGNGLQTGTASLRRVPFRFSRFQLKPARIYLGDSGSGGLAAAFTAASFSPWQNHASLHEE